MSNNISSGSLTFQSIAPPDMTFISKEDMVEDNFKEIPYRFGIPYELNIDIMNEGQISELPNGGHITRLAFNAKDAKSLNLIFSHFDLPTGGWMHLYNKDQSKILGAFTEANEQEDYLFATSFIFDDNLGFWHLLH